MKNAIFNKQQKKTNQNVNFLNLSLDPDISNILGTNSHIHKYKIKAIISY